MSVTGALFDFAKYKLCDTSDVPNIGAHAPAMFQLPSCNWCFSIFATHFCKS